MCCWWILEDAWDFTYAHTWLRYSLCFEEFIYFLLLILYTCQQCMVPMFGNSSLATYTFMLYKFLFFAFIF